MQANLKADWFDVEAFMGEVTNIYRQEPRRELSKADEWINCLAEHGRQTVEVVLNFDLYSRNLRPFCRDTGGPRSTDINSDSSQASSSGPSMMIEHLTTCTYDPLPHNHTPDRVLARLETSHRREAWTTASSLGGTGSRNSWKAYVWVRPRDASGAEKVASAKTFAGSSTNPGGIDTTWARHLGQKMQDPVGQMQPQQAEWREFWGFFSDGVPRTTPLLDRTYPFPVQELFEQWFIEAETHRCGLEHNIIFEMIREGREDEALEYRQHARERREDLGIACTPKEEDAITDQVFKAITPIQDDEAERRRRRRRHRH